LKVTAVAFRQTVVVSEDGGTHRNCPVPGVPCAVGQGMNVVASVVAPVVVAMAVAVTVGGSVRVGVDVVRFIDVVRVAVAGIRVVSQGVNMAGATRW
jgi:hypothetical protein